MTLFSKPAVSCYQYLRLRQTVQLRNYSTTWASKFIKENEGSKNQMPWQKIPYRLLFCKYNSSIPQYKKSKDRARHFLMWISWTNFIKYKNLLSSRLQFDQRFWSSLCPLKYSKNEKNDSDQNEFLSRLWFVMIQFYNARHIFDNRKNDKVAQ